MIDRQHGNLVFECDSCDEIFDADTGEFAEAWNAAKLEEWRAKKIGSDWVHACGKCGDANG